MNIIHKQEIKMKIEAEIQKMIILFEELKKKRSNLVRMK
jgi:hypothetical protein